MNYNSYLQTTLDATLFQCEDVYGDNKCFYRSITNGLVWHSNLNKLYNAKKLISKKSFKIKNNYNDVLNGSYFKNMDLYENYIDFQTDSSRLLEIKIKNWISNNRNTVYEPFGSYIYDIVRMTHDMTIEQYLDTENNDLWGGLVEQIAFANIYKCPIRIFRPITYNTLNNRINEGIIRDNKPNKNVRYQLAQVINPSSIKNLPIYLLWKRYKNGTDHYMTLYLKDFSNEDLIISNCSSS
jgi:hypothetical protein